MPLDDSFAAFRWWAVLAALGTAAFPLTYRLLGRLPDRGYAFSKLVGLLIVSYLFWLGASLGFLGNDLGGILLALMLLVGLSLWAYAKSGNLGDSSSTPLSWLKSNWKYVLVTELVFALVFGFWVWVRAQNPAIVATEKPMEFAFLNSVGRSPSFPPLDPWLSGFGISYYYFGYVMTSVIGRLAQVQEPIGFNLAIAWLAAGTALGAFGIVYNLLAANGRAVRRSAVAIGLIAAIALPIAGNLEILLELLHANDVGTDSFWTWLDVRDLSAPAVQADPPRYETAQWWWWRSSRVIHEYNLSGVAEEGLEPIAEVPAFSFVLGDLHPHVLALPFAFLSLAVAYCWWLRPGNPRLEFNAWFSRKGKLALISEEWRPVAGKLAFTSLILGGLSFLNTWDVLIHLFVVTGAYMLSLWRDFGRWSKELLANGATFALLLGVPAVLLYLPFYLGFRSQASFPFLLPMVMRPTRLIQFLIIFGMPMFSVVTLLVTLVLAGGIRRKFRFAHSLRIGLLVSGGVVLSLFGTALLLGWAIALSPAGAARIAALAAELEQALPALTDDAPALFRIRWATAALLALLPALVSARLSTPALIVFLALLIASAVALLVVRLNIGEEVKSRASEGGGKATLPFVLLLVVTATLLTLGPEFLYLKDVFNQRLNTVFKFYYQAWVMFGVSGLFALGYLLRNFRFSGIVASGAYAAALVVSLLFPLYAINSRAIEYRGPASNSGSRLPATLDGLAHMNRYNAAEHEAITWLRRNLNGSPVTLEAVGGQYSGYGRVSAGTGLPTVLGWPGHEYQWRGDTPEPAEREDAVNLIYGPTSWSETKPLLDRYLIEYVFFGELERTTYSPEAAEKFDQNLGVAYRNQGLTIYQYEPTAGG